MTKTLKKGFTLVELIVVIAIIAILATVSVVGYSAFIKNANQSKVNQELAQVENLLMAEAIEGIVIETFSTD
ncbi:MAG TPA: prepilin-type N-terminal cleavage/methylation domain-containing protein, partial [Gallicola sp.]|nr:prepilin-type N-terminal cleavage/methylation domain-containing protein [Gallicola sp.]